MAMNKKAEEQNTQATTQALAAATAEHYEGMLIVSEHGQTRVSEEVVAKIAGLAVREVPGVRSLVPFGAGQTLSSLASQLRGNDMKGLGIHVEVGTIEVAVDVRIVADYGLSIPYIAEQIRENLALRVTEMTGLRLKEVNIEVVDLYFPDEQLMEQPKALPARVQ